MGIILEVMRLKLLLLVNENEYISEINIYNSNDFEFFIRDYFLYIRNS